MPAPPDYGLTSQELAAIEKAAQWIAVKDITANQLRLFVGSAIPDGDLASKAKALSTGQWQSILAYLQARRSGGP